MLFHTKIGKIKEFLYIKMYPQIKIIVWNHLAMLNIYLI